MRYRTNSLFHFTKTKDTIIRILHSGCLYPNYCLEDLSFGTEEDLSFGIPEICFCDIPLSRSQDLIENYGNYAIAFNKHWGIEHGCNPVMYIANERVLSMVIHIVKRFKELKKIEDQCIPYKEPRLLAYEIRKAVIDQNLDNMRRSANQLFNMYNDKEGICYILGYTKKYNGEWKGKEYCNYLENEWRHVIEDGVGTIRWLNKDEYLKWRGDLLIQDDLLGNMVASSKPEPPETLKNAGIPFTTNDISHIVLKNESEVSEFAEQITHLSTADGKRLNSNDRNHLLSKVTSFERIMNDY